MGPTSDERHRVAERLREQPQWTIDTEFLEMLGYLWGSGGPSGRERLHALRGLQVRGHAVVHAGARAVQEEQRHLEAWGLVQQGHPGERGRCGR